jgi:spermidine/putrescine transport system substrate-binding protein
MRARSWLTASAFAAGQAFGAGAARAEGELFIYGRSNTIPPELLQKFEQETGIKITFDEYESAATPIARLRAGAAGYDVVVAADALVKIMVDEGLEEEIDARAMPNFKNVVPPHDSPPFDPERRYSVPYLWGTTGFSYDSARVPDGELDDSWRSFFEPMSVWQGEIAVLNDEIAVYNAAAYYLGVDKCTENTEDGQKILAVLRRQKPYVATYQSSGTIERMVAGKVIVHMQGNADAHRTRLQRPSVVYVYPREGVDFWSDNLVVPKGAPNVDNAKTFLNWMMAPENVAMSSNFAGYMNAIEGSGEFLDKALADDPAINMPAEYASRLVPGVDCSAAARELRDQVWTRLRK